MLFFLLLMPWALDVQAQEDTNPPGPEVPAAEEPLGEEPPPLTRLPELVEFVQAPYPEAALAAGIEGAVGLVIEIDATGVVTHAEVIRPLSPELDAAALEVAPKLIFSPAEDETGPVPVLIEFDYGFVLDASKKEGALPETDPADLLPINLDGTVLEMATRRPLSDMGLLLVELEQTATTDDAGYFAFHGVASGTHTLRIARPGWRTLERSVEVVDGEISSGEFWVKNDSWSKDEAVGVYRRAREEVTRRTLSVQEIRRIPGTFGDPLRVIQNLPGAARAPFGTGMLVIRGSNPEDSAVYVDGIRIPLIYHLGGYVSVINADLLESIDYLPGGYGVQYGRSMGGVVDVTTKKKSPDTPRLTWSTDILDSGGLYEARLGDEGQHHVAVAARRSYIDAILPYALKNTGVTALPRWYDYQLRYHHSGTWDTTALVFGFEDNLFFSTDPDIPQGTDPDTQGDAELMYGTHRGLVMLEREFSDTFSFRFVPSFGVDIAQMGLGQSFDVDNEQWMLEMRTEARWAPSPRVEVVPGVDFLGGWYKFKIDLPFSPADALENGALGERQATTLADAGSAWGPDFYLKTHIRPLDDPDQLLVTAGLRTSFITVPGQYDTRGFDPRFSFRSKILERTTLKGGAGIYTQPPLPHEGWHPKGNVEIGMERALSASLGAEQAIGQAVMLDVEGFYKDLSDLIIDDHEITDLRTQQAFINGGVGRIYGMEAMLRREPVDEFFGWISYTLSRSERMNRPWEEGEVWYPYELDQTHIFVALAGVDLPRSWRASGRFRYITGNPYTPYSLGVYDIDSDFYLGIPSGERNTERMPDFYSLDLRVERRLTFKTWRLDLYTDLLNVWHGVNAEYSNYNYDYTEQDWVRGLPFIPSIGFDVEVWL